MGESEVSDREKALDRIRQELWAWARGFKEPFLDLQNLTVQMPGLESIYPLMTRVYVPTYHRADLMDAKIMAATMASLYAVSSNFHRKAVVYDSIS